jgi:hypothetical protein
MGETMSATGTVREESQSMEFSVTKSALLDELTTTQGVVERKTTLNRGLATSRVIIVQAVVGATFFPAVLFDFVALGLLFGSHMRSLHLWLANCYGRADFTGNHARESVVSRTFRVHTMAVKRSDPRNTL